LRFADGAVVDPVSIGSLSSLGPEYPRSLFGIAPGKCVSGWITYAVPASARPVAEERSLTNVAVDWKI
jgi:hypothetical protein